MVAPAPVGAASAFNSCSGILQRDSRDSQDGLAFEACVPQHTMWTVEPKVAVGLTFELSRDNMDSQAGHGFEALIDSHGVKKLLWTNGSKEEKDT